ncbi:hypothetical protein [Klebsiella pneumoniae]|uniref:hypothetical protein n=1 Tax=Klebsiella pneumoniae TaxID=573 RepID=UPI002AB9CB93|nr:hypothetical protein [Klebsiella pneumoniae]
MAEVPLPTPTDNPVPSTDIRDAVYAGAMLDKVVTSTELTYTDRLGGEHYTVDGIKAEGDKVVEETRQNLIPLSRQYMTLAEAQADIANIPEGSSTYVRSPDSSALADEYMNVAGTLTATGRRMPSQAAIQAVLDYISSLIATDDAGSPLLTLNDEAGFRLAAFGLNAIQSNAMNAEYDPDVSGFVFRDSVGFVIQQIGTPLLSAVDSIQPVLEQQRLVSEAFSAEYDPDVSGLVFRDSVGFVLMNLNGEQGNQDISGADDISRRNAANLAAAAAARDEINTTAQRPVFDININIVMGQSYGNGTQGYPALTREIKSGLNLKMLGGSVRPLNVNSGSTFTPVGDVVLNPLRAVNQSDTDGHIMTDEEVLAASSWLNHYGESVDVGGLQMWRNMQYQLRGIASDERQIVTLNCCVGGQIIENLEKGASTGYYNRIISAVNQVKALADAAGKTCGVTSFLYLGNEYNYDSTRGGTTDRAVYRTKLRKLIDDVIADTRAITGQDAPPLTVIYQTGGSYTRDAARMSIGEAQLDICAADPNVVMASPNYMVTGKGGHPDANGYRWLSMQFGKVLHRAIDRGQRWRPLQPRNITISGQTVRIDFLVWHPPLQFRAAYAISGVANNYAARGFRVTDDSGDVPITSVSIVADTVVDIVLGRATTGDVWVWYGSETASGGCGNLFDSDPTVAIANYEYRADLGERPSANVSELVNKPYPLNNPCVAFRRQAIII